MGRLDVQWDETPVPLAQAHGPCSVKFHPTIPILQWETLS